MSVEKLQRWRLILGKSAEEGLSPGACRLGPVGSLLSGDQVGMDEALDAVYAEDDGVDLTKEDWMREPGAKHGAVKGRTYPKVARWLGEIRRLFPTDIVSLVQKDAIERR